MRTRSRTILLERTDKAGLCCGSVERQPLNRAVSLLSLLLFRYDRERDVYQCPQGQVLEFRFDTVEQERHIRYYKTSACRDCPVKDLCTSSKDGRRITRWADEHLLEAMAERVKTNRDKMKQRQMIVEHPYGTLKRGMNQEYFLCRGLTKVRAEMSLSILAYNLKRAINIPGIEAMMAGLTRMKLPKA